MTPEVKDYLRRCLASQHLSWDAHCAEVEALAWVFDALPEADQAAVMSGDLVTEFAEVQAGEVRYRRLTRPGPLRTQPILPILVSAAEHTAPVCEYVGCRVKPSIELYTDGACRKTGEGGWGYVLRVTASGKEIEGSGGVTGTTSQRMELTAALMGLQRLECPCKVRLVSDSQYLVKGLTSWVRMWERDGWTKAGGDPVLNRDLWVSLLAQSRRHDVTAEWVRGHSGHPENERCDKLATAASRTLATPPAVT